MNKNDSEDLNYMNMMNRSAIPTCNILGVDIAAINMEWLLEYTVKNINDLSGEYMCVSNVHTTIIAYEDENYRSIQNNALMAIPDGGPLSSVGRKSGYKSMARTTGPGYMEAIMQMSVQKGYRHYFYGSTEETLEKMYHNLKKKYPEIKIVGMYSPPFRMLTENEKRDVLEKINMTKADFVWIGLGAPKQECWMAEHYKKVTGFMVGVGAGFDYMAENIKRAPKWMRQCNLEWMYRLLQDPKRLFKRYLTTNSKFLWLVLTGELKNVCKRKPESKGITTIRN